MSYDKKVRKYTKKQLDIISLELIREGKDIRFDVNRKLYIVNIKEYEALLRFERPELFKNEKDTNI